MDANSLDAYRSIVENLGPRQQIIFEALRNNPASNKTLAKRLGLEINQVTPRTLELRKKGLVKKMYCEIEDGHSATVWGVSLWPVITKPIHYHTKQKKTVSKGIILQNTNSVQNVDLFSRRLEYEIILYFLY